MKKMNLSSKFILFAITISMIPMVFNLVISIVSNQKMQNISVEESMKLGNSDMDHIVENVHAMCLAQNGLAQEIVNNALKTSRNILETTGKVTISRDDRVSWDAVNQFTKESTKIELPRMLVGEKWLGKNREMDLPSPIVDKTRDLSVETCTIFQRMNKKGDMLRVCTNVKKLDGKRAIGTFIPAMNPDGTPNAVVSTVLNGETFHGRAFVVNAWYITAYEPIFDESNRVVGILYVGIRQKTLEKSMVDEIVNIKVGKTGYVYVLNSKGEYIVSRNNEQNGENVWKAKDSDGHPYIQEIIKKAHRLNREGIATHRYFMKSDEQVKRAKIVKIKYFKEWDWIIGVDASEKDFLVARDKIVRMGIQSNYLFAATSGVVLILAIVISFIFARRITKPIMLALNGLHEGADQTFVSSSQVSALSRSLAERSSHHAESIVKTSSSMEEISSMTRQNAGNAVKADSFMKDVNAVIDTADNSMEQVIGSMEEISKASEEISKIIRTIDEIAFQTNLLALNAAVEAARAGEAGVGFAVVADEVRNLAMRAADAAKSTADLIEGTVKKVEEGSEIVSATNEAFKKVSESAAKVGGLVAEISRASNDQSNGIEQINMTIVNMDKMIQENATTADHSALAAAEMNNQAEQLKSHVRKLAMLVTGKNERTMKTVHAPGPASRSERRMLPSRKEEVKPGRMIPFEED